jgi:hypothetical protein
LANTITANELRDSHSNGMMAQTTAADGHKYHPFKQQTTMQLIERNKET